MKKALVLLEVDIDVIDGLTESESKKLVKEYVRGADFTYQNEAWHTDVKNPEVLSVVLEKEKESEE